MIIKKLPLKVILVAYLFVLAGCSHNRHYWSPQLPDQKDFMAIYLQDQNNLQKQTKEEYLTWIERFYLGWELYRRGWIKTTDDLVEQIESPAERQEIRKKMEKLGFAISSEWAKKTNTRRIFTRHVSIWGNALLESLERGESETLINKVMQDVNALLAHKLEPEMITANRYYPEDDNNPFL